MGKTFWGVLGALFVFFILLPIGCTIIVGNAAKNAADTVSKDFKSAATSKASDAAKSVGDTQNVGSPSSGWSYRSDVDKMRNIETRYASVSSENQLQFSFPYGGGSSGMITLREKGKSLNVLLSIDKGQFTCNSFNDETVAVKFDDHPIENFHCVGPNDGTVGLIFIESEKRFLNSLKKSKHVIVEAGFYQEGRQQLEFNTAGLKWD